MAARFWVGGAGTWDATSTVHWSDTSGGAAGFSAPTSADTATFNSASNATAYAVTIGTNAVCLDVSIAGPGSGSVTITSGATAVINVYGSWLSAATGVVFSSTAGAVINFLATTTGKTITTNNIAIGALNVSFNSVSGGWTLGSAFNQAGAGISVAAGSFDTGSYAIISSLIVSSGGVTRSIALGSSTLTLSNAAPITFSASLTFNAGTSTITCSSANVTFVGGGQTFYNVSFSNTALGTSTITGANTFNNLTQVTSTTQRIVTLGANQTVNGTLTLGATNTAPLRVTVGSDVVGTQRTLTVATLATLADVDFRDIVAAGTSSPWSGTRLGNCLNNSNITFAAGATKYWNLAAGGNWNANAWALTSGGAVAVNNFPLAQDSVIIEDTGLTAGNTITINTNADIGSLSMATRTTALTLALGNTDPRFYGNVTLSSTLTTTGTGGGSPSYTFAGQGLANTFNSAGVTLRVQQFIINCPTGSLTLQSDTTVELVAASTGIVFLTAGTFDLGGFNLTANQFSSTNSNVRTLAFGTNNITLTAVATTVFDTTTATNMTITGTPVVNCTAITGTAIQTRIFIAGNFVEAQSISVNINPGTSAIDIFRLATTNGSFNNITFSSTFTGTVQISNAINIFGSLDFGGATAYTGASAVTFAATSGIKTIRTNGRTFGGGVVFSGVGGAWNCLDALLVANAITLSNGTLNLAAGTTSTVGAFTTSGTTMKYLGSTTPGTQATISDAGGTDTVTYLTIQDSNATGGATWSALSATNVDAGNNTGWFFSIPPKQAFEYTVRLRSFTQPWRF